MTVVSPYNVFFTAPRVIHSRALPCAPWLAGSVRIAFCPQQQGWPSGTRVFALCLFFLLYSYEYAYMRIRVIGDMF